MGDLASDHDAAIELIVEEYKRLESHGKNHELLKYLEGVSDEEIKYSNDNKIREEFIDKYAKRKDTPYAVMLTNYFIDLRNAVDSIEGIDRSPPSSNQPSRNLEELSPEDDLPF